MEHIWLSIVVNALLLTLGCQRQHQFSISAHQPKSKQGQQTLYIKNLFRQRWKQSGNVAPFLQQTNVVLRCTSVFCFGVIYETEKPSCSRLTDITLTADPLSHLLSRSRGRARNIAQFLHQSTRTVRSNRSKRRTSETARGTEKYVWLSVISLFTLSRRRPERCRGVRQSGSLLTCSFKILQLRD